MLKTRLTLEPGANGTKRLVAQYGQRLVCVRYRYDAEKQRRYKTIELIEEERPWIAASEIYLVAIRWEESALREAIRNAGARWNSAKKVWMATGSVVRKLGVQDRVVGWIDPE